MNRRPPPPPDQPPAEPDTPAADDQAGELVPLGRVLLDGAAEVDTVAAYAAETLATLEERARRFLGAVGEPGPCPRCGRKTHRVKRAGRSRSDMFVDDYPRPLTPHGDNCTVDGRRSAPRS